MALYVSVDIETTGKDPTKHAVLSIGACAVRVGQHEVAHQEGEFYINLPEPQDPQAWDPDTYQWWQEQNESARQAYKVEPTFEEDKAIAMFTAWLLSGLERKTIERREGEMGPEPVNLIFYPTIFDYRFLLHLAGKWLHGPDLYNFWFSYGEMTAVDLTTMAATLLQLEQYQGRRSHWPKEWREHESGLTLHNALDDARIQMGYYLAMRKWARENNKSAYVPQATTAAEEGK